LPSTLTHHHTVKQSRKSYSGKYFAYQSKRKSIPNPSFTKGRELYEYDESKTRVIKHNESTGKITQYINDFFDIEDGQEKLYFYSGDLKLATLDSSSSAPTGDPDECDVPTSGNWTVNSDCTIATFETAPADVTITAGTVLTIASSGILEVDLNNNSLTVENGGGILIENGGSLAQSGLLPPPSQGGGQGEIYLVFHHSDHLSGASVDTDESGSVVALNDYYPFGDTRIESGEYENDYTYTGKERDEDTELLYYEARYYNSNIGRFISLDPWSGDITDPQSLNKYAYTLNNPLKYTDPDGEHPAVIGAAALAQAVVDAVVIYVGTKKIVDGVTDVVTTSTTTEPAEKGDGVMTTPAQTPSTEGNTYTTPSTTPEAGSGTMTTPATTPDGTGAITTPATTPEGTGIITQPGLESSATGCGANMSCDVSEEHGLSVTGIPNSTGLRWRDGEIVQGRTYDEEGDATVDTDMTNHGNPTIPAPHAHEWNKGENGKPSRSKEHKPITQGK
jgi:RHS repeat-associated protein